MIIRLAASSPRSRPCAAMTSCGPIDQLVEQLVEFQTRAFREFQVSAIAVSMRRDLLAT